MELKQIDSLDTQSSQGRVALAPYGIRMKRSYRDLHPILRIPLEAALGEDIGPIGRGDRLQELSDNFFGVSEPINRGGVDPVHTAIDRVAHCRDRRLIVLRPP
jgi:hypothetical protein